MTARPVSDPLSREIPKFMSNIEEALTYQEQESKQLRPDSPAQDLFLDLERLDSFIVDAIQRSWFVYTKEGPETLWE